MTGFSVEIEFSDKALLRQLERLQDQMEDLAPFYKNVGEHIQEVTPQNFENETAPDGTPWEKLSPVTLAAREERGTGSTIYREYGDFIGSINYQASSDDFRWGTNDVRGRIFQLGGKAGRGKKVTLPARPYIGLSPADEDEILQIAKDHVGL
jgi:phage virion morphogenesis protein